MNKESALDNRIRGIIAEVVMGGITLLWLAFEFFFPKNKKHQVMSQEDIKNIVFKEKTKCHQEE